ncbi:hypothetical protein P5V15_010604 [Pogonomyrmex californicus]
MAHEVPNLKCNLFDVFQNNDFSIVQKYTSWSREFRQNVDTKIEQRLLCEKDFTEKKSINAERIKKLEQDINTVKSDINATVLQQNVINKMISNITILKENLNCELIEAKVQRETLLLEMMNLESEIEERQKKKVLQWDAIKRACHCYKKNLDIHISLNEEKDCQYIKISFFIHNEAMKDKYFVQLTCNHNHWKVEQIEPKLRKEHLEKITVIDSECSRVSNITLFLCQVRSIFLKHYMKTEK